MSLTSCKDNSGKVEKVELDETPPPKTGLEPDQLLEVVTKSKREFVIVNFFATWCGPCKVEIPDLVAMQHERKRVDVVLVSIDSKEDVAEKLRPWLADLGVDFETYTRSGDEIKFIKQFYPRFDGAIPLTLIYRNNGELLEVISGVTDRNEIDLVINKHQKLGNS